MRATANYWKNLCAISAESYTGLTNSKIKSKYTDSKSFLIESRKKHFIKQKVIIAADNYQSNYVKFFIFFNPA